MNRQAMNRQAMSRCGRAAALAVAVLGMAACGTIDDIGDFIFETQNPPLPGERLSVLGLEQQLTPDPRLAGEAVLLPAPYFNDSWPQSGGVPSHALHHLAVESEQLTEAWERSLGEGSDSAVRLLSGPVMAEGRVFQLDARGTVAAFDAKSGDRLWRRDIVPEDETDYNALGGGVAWYLGQVFVTTAFGDVWALEAATGEVAWTRAVGQPFRAPPTVSNGLVLAISFDNQLHALNAENGELLWNHLAIAEESGVLGGAAPAAGDGVVVGAFSSGELVGLDIATGQVLWTESLVRRTRGSALAALKDVDALPVIDRGRVFAIGNTGRMVALELRSGVRVWDAEVGGVSKPWVAGDHIFALTGEAEVVALSRDDGRVRWVTPLPRFEDPEDREDPIHWTGPVLVSDRLLVASSHGQVWALSPYTGRELGFERVSDGVYLPPIVADGWVYILTDDADLIALR